MKRMVLIYLLLLSSTLIGSAVFAQTPNDDDKDLYPKQYTFKKAKEFESKREFGKATWFYINLFPGHEQQVVESVKAMSAKMDSVDIGTFIRASFATYAMFDPTISTFKNGGPVINDRKLKEKGTWGDQLIKRVEEANGKP